MKTIQLFRTTKHDQDRNYRFRCTGVIAGIEVDFILTQSNKNKKVFVTFNISVEPLNCSC